jgi:hypothetical protein
MAFPTLSAPGGYKAFVVTESGTFNEVTRYAACPYMVGAGTQLMNGSAR